MQESEKARSIATELVHLSNKAHEFFKPVVEAYAQVERITGYRYFAVCEHDVFTPVELDDSGVCLESDAHYCGNDFEDAQDVKIPWEFFDDPEAVLKEAQEERDAKDRAHAQDSYRRAQEELERAQKNLERVKEKYGL